MRKTLLLTLILFIASLVGLYQMRVPLLIATFNTGLEDSDIRLLQLAGLKVGWDRLQIEELVLGAGENSARQTLLQVQLEYSLTDIRLQRLAVERVILNLPGGESAPESRDGAPLLLTALAEQLMAGPLESMTVSALEVNGLPIAWVDQPLQLQASWDGLSFSMLIQDADRQLQLQLQLTAPDQLLLTSRLSGDGGTVLELNATASRLGDQQQLQGEGRLVLVPALVTLLDLPAPIHAATGELVFQVSGLLNDDLSQLTQQSWELLVMPETELGLTLTADEPALDGELRFSIARPLAITLQQKNAGEFQLGFSGESLAFQLDEKRYSLIASGELSSPYCEYAGVLRCNSALTIALQAPKLALEGDEATTVTGFKLTLASQLTLDGNELNATLSAGEFLRVESLLSGDIRLEKPVLTAAGATNVNYQLDTGQWRLQADRLQLSLPRLEMPQLNLQHAGGWLAALAFEADVSIAQQLLSIKGQVHGRQQKPLFDLSADYQLDTQIGSGRILVDSFSFDADTNRLSQHFSHWPFEWDLYEGELMLDVSATWQGAGKGAGEGTEIRGKISQRLDGLAGVYEDIGFIGLDGNFEADFSYPDQLITNKAATFSLETLEVGVPIKNIHARFLVDAAQQQVTVQTAEAQLFGGRVWTEDAVYRTDGDPHRIDIGVDGVQLSQLLDLAGYVAVQGTGRISGLLPIDVNGKAVKMKRGMLAARAPGGIVRYHADIGAATNPALTPVMDALSNYHYTIFQVEADYLDNGDLILEMLLRGRNPDYEEGRPIHLNLNVTDNIPMLMKNLQSGRVITDIISRKLGDFH